MAKRTIAAVRVQTGDQKAVVILDNGDELHGLISVSVSAKAQGRTTGAIEFVVLSASADGVDGMGLGHEAPRG